MLIDQRTYTVKPGTMAKHLAIYQESALRRRSAIWVSHWPI